MNNPYLPRLAFITGIIEESGNTRTFTISLEGGTAFDPQPGQFIEFSLFGQGEFPVSIAGVVNAAEGIFQTTIRRMGGVTEKITELKLNDTVGIRGPFGKGYPLAAMKGKDVILVAGGVGMASIKYLVECLLKDRDMYKRIFLLYGAASQGDLLYKCVPCFYPSETEKGELEVLVTVDKPDLEWNGYVGNVIDLYKTIEHGIDIEKSIVAACGPGRMMKAVVDHFTLSGFKGEQLLLSFERRMQCGIGVCGHCRIGEKRVCWEGPVIPFHDIKDSLEAVF
jgi:sulfhydrogenase subunit gamma (sulfur reductase)